MEVNWKVRARSKTFWLTLIPACLLLAQAVATPFGYNWDLVVLEQQLAAIVNAAFGVLAVLGVVVDMTTEGLSDSDRALGYEEPYPKGAKHARGRQ